MGGGIREKMLRGRGEGREKEEWNGDCCMVGRGRKKEEGRVEY